MGYLDQTGLNTLWTKIKDKFVTKDSNEIISGQKDFNTSPRIWVEGEEPPYDLPDGYTPIKTLNSTQATNQPIAIPKSTLSTAEGDFDVEIKVRFISLGVTGGYGCIFGADSNLQLAYYADGKPGVGNTSGSKSIYYQDGTFTINATFSSTAANSRYYIDGVDTGLRRATAASTANLFIFGAAPTNYLGTMAIHYVKISRGGTQLFNFIPALQESSTLNGFYETIGQKFYTSAAVPFRTDGQYQPAGYKEVLTAGNFAKVATTGSYNDLNGRPTIPSAAANGQLTIQKNGTTVQTFTANQASNATANIQVPTKTSDLTNDSNFITDSYHDSTKQDALVSGTNIKTINSQSLLGSGNIVISGGSSNISKWTLFADVTVETATASYPFSINNSINEMMFLITTDTNYPSGTFYVQTNSREVTTAYANIGNIAAGKINQIQANIQRISDNDFVLTYGAIYSGDPNTVQAGTRQGRVPLFSMNNDNIVKVHATCNLQPGTRIKVYVSTAITEEAHDFRLPELTSTNVGKVPQVNSANTGFDYVELPSELYIVDTPTDVDQLSQIPTAVQNNKLPIIIYNGSWYRYDYNSSNFYFFSSLSDDTNDNFYFKRLRYNERTQTLNPGSSIPEDTSNKVTSISSSSTNLQYPTAKCVYDLVGDVAAALNALHGADTETGGPGGSSK